MKRLSRFPEQRRSRKKERLWKQRIRRKNQNITPTNKSR